MDYAIGGGTHATTLLKNAEDGALPHKSTGPGRPWSMFPAGHARLDTRHALSAGALPKALIFDVDGTLYRQGPVRRGMLIRLLAQAARNPVAGIQALRVLRAYRNAQEILRARATESDALPADLALEQVRLTAELTGTSQADVVSCATRWFDAVPLDLVRLAIFDGLLEFLAAARERGIRLAICSDYPASAKLRALGLANYFDVVVSAQDADVGYFKPHPRSLEVALARLGLAPQEVVFVGDRSEVDGAAATAAKVRFELISDVLVYRRLLNEVVS